MDDLRADLDAAPAPRRRRPTGARAAAARRAARRGAAERRARRRGGELWGRWTTVLASRLPDSAAGKARGNAQAKLRQSPDAPAAARLYSREPMVAAPASCSSRTRPPSRSRSGARSPARASSRRRGAIARARRGRASRAEPPDLVLLDLTPPRRRRPRPVPRAAPRLATCRSSCSPRAGPSSTASSASSSAPTTTSSSRSAAPRSSRGSAPSCAGARAAADAGGADPCWAASCVDPPPGGRRSTGAELELLAQGVRPARRAGAATRDASSRASSSWRDVWDENWFGSTKTLDVHIGWLRRKLGDDPAAPRFLQTVRGVGFRFAAPEDDGPEPSACAPARCWRSAYVAAAGHRRARGPARLSLRQRVDARGALAGARPGRRAGRGRRPDLLRPGRRGRARAALVTVGRHGARARARRRRARARCWPTAPGRPVRGRSYGRRPEIAAALRGRRTPAHRRSSDAGRRPAGDRRADRRAHRPDGRRRRAGHPERRGGAPRRAAHDRRARAHRRRRARARRSSPGSVMARAPSPARCAAWSGAARDAWPTATSRRARAIEGSTEQRCAGADVQRHDRSALARARARPAASSSPTPRISCARR